MAEQVVCRVPAERPPSDFARQALSGRSVVARRALGRQLARPLLAERSGD